MVDVSFTIIMQWINFGILLFLMYMFLYKPLIQFLDKRSQEIEQDINDASSKKVAAQKVLDDYESKLKGIKSEADKIFAEATKNASKEKDNILEAAQAESKNIVHAAQKEIQLEVEKAKIELKRATSELVVSCASKVLEREVNEQDHKKFIDSFLQEEGV